MNKQEIFSKIKQANFKPRSFPERVGNLILESEFDKPLTSQQFIELYNDGPSKNIKIGSLTALFQPLLQKGVIKTKTLREDKKKTKVWFPAWIDGKKVSNLDASVNPLKNFHPEIKRVSEKLFNDKHYAQAIEEAFKKVINLVKKKSEKNNLDGYPLMSTVFSKQNPILKFNSLLDRTDEDEQQGWMHLYQGAVLGIRNVKTHNNIIQKDKQKALEYLAFASLLCRRLEDTKK